VGLQEELCDKLQQAERREHELSLSLEKARAKQISPRKPPLSPRIPTVVGLAAAPARQCVGLSAAPAASQSLQVAHGQERSGAAAAASPHTYLGLEQEILDEFSASIWRLEELLQCCVSVAELELQRQSVESEALMMSMHDKVGRLEEFLEQSQEHIKDLEAKIAAMSKAQRQDKRASNHADASGESNAGPRRLPRLARVLCAVLVVLAGVYAYDVWVAPEPQIVPIALQWSPMQPSSHGETCRTKSCAAGEKVGSEMDRKRGRGAAESRDSGAPDNGSRKGLSGWLRFGWRLK
jgi:hypothetical protein